MGLETAALVGLALSAAGTGAQMYASNREASNMNDAAKAELIRQKGFQKQASGEFQKSLGDSTPTVAKTQTQQGTNALLDTMGKVSATPVVTPSSVAGVAPSSVVGQEAKAANKLSDVATANYGGMNEWQLRQWIKDLRTSQNLQVIQNLARGQEGTLPLVLQQAGQSAEGARLLGTGLQAAGGVVGASGAGGGASRSSSFLNLFNRKAPTVSNGSAYNWLYNLPKGT